MTDVLLRFVGLTINSLKKAEVWLKSADKPAQRKQRLLILLIAFPLFSCCLCSLCRSCLNLGDEADGGEAISVAETATPTETPMPTATATPTRTPTPTPTPITISLPQTLLVPDGLSFILTEIQVLSNIGSHRPDNGYFVVLLGYFENGGSSRNCTHSSDFTVSNGQYSGEVFELDTSLLAAAKPRFERDYPGSFLGQCLNAGEQEPTFIIFDLTAGLDNVWLHTVSDDLKIGDIDHLQSLAIVAITPTVTPTFTPSPISTNTPTRTAIPTATPTIEPAALATVTQAGNLRAGPGTQFDVVGTVSVEDFLEIFGQNADGSWLLVSRTEQLWIWSSLVEITSSLSAIPVPPTMTPSRTPRASATPRPLPTSTFRPPTATVFVPQATATAAPAPSGNCDPAYPTVCIPSPPPDLDCGEISFRNFQVLPPDPHRFDGDNDGIGCES